MQEILTKKSGAVQNSPPNKSEPQIGPWSPVWFCLLDNHLFVVCISIHRLGPPTQRERNYTISEFFSTQNEFCHLFLSGRWAFFLYVFGLVCNFISCIIYFAMSSCVSIVEFQVKRKTNQVIGPFDCTKHTNNVPPSSQ